jgi:pimeloyl-ACP methyl ester carboxylesterase
MTLDGGADVSWVDADGIRTRFKVLGQGPPILLFSPGGFDASLEAWHSHDHYRRLGLLESLQERYSCIIFDKREAGASGGRLQRITWHDYARQAVALLDHLGVGRAHLLGACIGLHRMLGGGHVRTCVSRTRGSHGALVASWRSAVSDDAGAALRFAPCLHHRSLAG